MRWEARWAMYGTENWQSPPLGRWVAFVGILQLIAFFGCSSEAEDANRAYLPDQVDASTPVHDAGLACIDEDGDGFGVGCVKGADCDDSDPEVTDACYRCRTPNDECACDEEGVKAECGELTSRNGDRVVCAVGERVCSGGKWGPCSLDSMKSRSLTLPPDLGEAVSTNPVPCKNNPCDPYCVEFPSTPPQTDGGVEIEPDGGIVLEPAPDPNAPIADCISTPQEAKRLNLGMVLAVDRSGSMTETVGGVSRWNRVRPALQTFVTSPGVSGMNAALAFFPPLSGDQCQQPRYESPNLAVGMGQLVTNPSPNPQVNAINNQIATVSISGGTPMLPALRGAAKTAFDFARQGSDRKGVVVLVTDGLPEHCTECPTGKKGKSEKNEKACAVQEVAQVAEAYFFGTPSVETFVIGVQNSSGDNLQYLDVIARAGSGGRRGAVIVNNNATASQQIIDALNAVRDQSLSCEFKVPTPTNSVIDPSTTKVTFTPSMGAPVSIPKVNTLGACGSGDGFYYNTTGPKIELCPRTCATAKSDMSARIDIEYSCKSGCRGGSAEAEPGPIDMLVLMDRSGSMEDNVAGGAVNRWQAATVSLRNFVRSPDSEGMGFGITYFPPHSTCQRCTSSGKDTPWPFCGDNPSVTCSPAPTGFPGNKKYYAGYSSTCTASAFAPTSGLSFPGVDINPLPGGSNSHANRVIDSLNAVIPAGGTPTRPALEGAIAYAKAKRKPGRKSVVVLVTDGEPNDCSSTAASTATVAKNGYEKDSIETFVLGVGGSLSSLNQVARAGSGNRYDAFLVNDSDPSGFIEAMNTIRRRAMSCAFDIPTPAVGKIDFESPEIVLTAGKPVATETTLEKVNNGTACGTKRAWHYDSNTDPKQIILCPAVCGTVQADLDARVDILYQCRQDYEPGSIVFEYDVSGACGQGAVPAWADWSWKTVTPSDSKVEFSVATGTRLSDGTIPNVSSDVPMQFTRADLSGKRVCASAPNVCFPGVSVDTQRGGPLVMQPNDAYIDETLRNASLPRHDNYLRVTVSMSPSSSQSKSPVLTNWDLRVSCKPGE